MVAALNKTSLRQQRDQLALYERFLPSLDLKRQQLTANLQRAREVLAAVEREIEQKMSAQAGLFSLLGASEQDLSGLLRVVSVVVVEENVLGVRVPVLKDVQFRVTEYSMLAKPFWVDLLVELLQEAGKLQIRCSLERERVRRLGAAVRRITQRVNLFEQVLIPRAQETIRQIRIYLADAERAAVIRSKIAKAGQQRDAARTGEV